MIAARQCAIALATPWRSHLLALVLAVAVLLLLFIRDLCGLVTIWWTSSTFNHCLLIVPIIGWLIWQRCPELRELTPRAWPPGLILLAGGATSWLIGDVAGVALARHLGLVLMVQAMVATLLGPSVTRGILFPLAYAFFLVPMGEGLVPPLQTLTARICMALLAVTGIPAHMEGVFITVPGGWFEVAEACSGVKFLVAMAAYGVLVANVCFKSWPRRIAFMTAALILPVLANGLRAFATIYIAHETDLRFAAGFDHVVYGWIFFALVIALLMAVGWPWFDRKPNEAWIDVRRLAARDSVGDRLPLALTGACLIPVMVLMWSFIAAAGTTALPARSDLPAIPGWSAVTASGTPWQPHFAGADRLLIGHYRNAAGQRIDLAIAVYASQSEGRELVGFGQGAIGPESRWAWTDNAPPPPGGRAFRITGPGGVVRDVITFYRVGDITTGSAMRVKIETLKAKLFGGPKRAVAILISSEQQQAGQSARPVMNRFIAGLGPIDRLADRYSMMTR